MEVRLRNPKSPFRGSPQGGSSRKRTTQPDSWDVATDQRVGNATVFRALVASCSVSVTSKRLLPWSWGNPLESASQYEAGRDCDVEYPLKQFRRDLQKPV